MSQAEHERNASEAWSVVTQMEQTLLKHEGAIEAMQLLLNQALEVEAAVPLNWALDRVREYHAELSRQHDQLFHTLNPAQMPTSATFRRIAAT